MEMNHSKSKYCASPNNGELGHAGRMETVDDDDDDKDKNGGMDSESPVTQKGEAKDSVLRKLTEHIRETYDTISKLKQDADATNAAADTVTQTDARGEEQETNETDETLPNPCDKSPATATVATAIDSSSSPPSPPPSNIHHALSSSHNDSSKGACLTRPSAPTSNNGRDNAEGNLIVSVGDIIGSHDNSYMVLGSLGQGTFAQVFHCRPHPPRAKSHEQNNQLHVAIKIVKNRPAYARQAAVEIDIFRALENDPRPLKQAIHLRQHFLNAHHLCLVFELLGQNLYEVLKARQFRGLPLGVVRGIIKQATEGVAELTKRGVVHCDLKPENILVSNEEGEGVLSALDSSTHAPAAVDTMESAHGRLLIGSENSGVTSTDGISLVDAEAEAERMVKIKLIDFGSACFEGRTAHTYIQSRFYRSPEVLIGLPYDSAIDMWSLGCVAAELFLGLPILPGVHEHDQLWRIQEMIAPFPDWMIEEGSKSHLYFGRTDSKPFTNTTTSHHRPVRKCNSHTSLHTHAENHSQQQHPSSSLRPPAASSPRSPQPPSQWTLWSSEEYASSRDGVRKGAVSDSHNKNRYFRQKKLSDIIMKHGTVKTPEDRAMLTQFVHFLTGVLEPDPWKRWTSLQASSHPFLTGNTSLDLAPFVSSSNAAQQVQDPSFWTPRWDPSICRRKLIHVEKSREMQQQRNKGRDILNGTRHEDVDTNGNHTANATKYLNSSPERKLLARGKAISPEFSGTCRVTAMTETLSLSTHSSASHHRLSRSPKNQHHSPGNAKHSHHHPMVVPANPHDSLGWVRRSPGTLRRVPSLTMPGNWSEPQYGAAVVTNAVPGYNYSFTPTLPASVTGAGAQPQSYSGMSHLPSQTIGRGDFGYALSRPGVLPGDGNIHHHNHVGQWQDGSPATPDMRVQQSQHVPLHQQQQNQQQQFMMSTSASALDHGRSNGGAGTPVRSRRRRRGNSFVLAGGGQKGDTNQVQPQQQQPKTSQSNNNNHCQRSLLSQQLEDQPPQQQLQQPHPQPTHQPYGVKHASEDSSQGNALYSPHHNLRTAAPLYQQPGSYHSAVFRQNSMSATYDMSPTYLATTPHGTTGYHTPILGGGAGTPMAAAGVVTAPPLDPRSLPHLYGSYGTAGYVGPSSYAPALVQHFVPAGTGGNGAVPPPPLVVVGGGTGHPQQGYGSVGAIGANGNPLPGGHLSPHHQVLRPSRSYTNYGTSM